MVRTVGSLRIRAGRGAFGARRARDRKRVRVLEIEFADERTVWRAAARTWAYRRERAFGR